MNTPKFAISMSCIILCAIPCMGLTGPAWTWVGGPSTPNGGVYGTKGVADPNNIPGARYDSITWKDGSGNIWLFGGSAGKMLNDLWKFDGADWTWVSGSSSTNQLGIYGTKGTAAPENIPGARFGSVSWIDASGNLWLFGGEGYGIDMGCCGMGHLNDLWMFDGQNWTWVGGSNAVFAAGVYGTKGVPDACNVPGCRCYATSCADANGNFWLFGGLGDTDTGAGYLNDLWKFDGAMWTWVGGTKLDDQAGVYGTKGVADAANVPEGRGGSVSWIDSNGNFWVFGGHSGLGTEEHYLNDLWKFDGTNWTWVGGSSLPNQSGGYGTKGVADACNVPGARRDAASWTDDSGNPWLFGGRGYSGTLGYLNDLWRFDGANWTWVSGSNAPNQYGVYGTEGVAGSDNVPGSRYNPALWADDSGALYLFGGTGFRAGGSSGRMNDLWKFGFPQEAADITGDGAVNELDLMTLIDQWESPSATSTVDIAPQPAGDGTVNLRDFAVLAGRWLESI
jgi:hypothetical protein